MKFKRILSLLASAAMAMTAITGAMSVSVVSAEDEVNYKMSGTCGKEASWIINSDGALIISGKGEMTETEDGTSGKAWGWEELKSGITEIIFEDGVSIAGYHAFTGDGINNFSATSKIILPPSLTSLNGCLDINVLHFPNLDDIYVYSKNVTDASTIYYSSSDGKPQAWHGSGKIWHVFKGSDTEESLRNDLKLTDEDIEYLEDNAKMPPVENKTPAELEPVRETSGPSGISSKYEWNNSTKTLTFSGKGAITVADNYTDYANETEHIVIDSGIIGINANGLGESGSQGAFTGFTKLKDVKLPDTLQFIGYYSFFDTTLTNIIGGIPEALKAIGDYAFKRCPLEGDLKLPKSVHAIGQMSFSNTNITSVNLYEGMSLGGQSFAYCNLLKEVTIPNNLFYGGNGELNSVRANAAFLGCESLEKVIIKGGGSVYSMHINIKENGIGENLFGNCTSLNKIIIDSEDITFVGTYGKDNQTFDMTNNPTFYIYKDSTTEQTLKDAGYLTEENTVYIADFAKLEKAIADAETVETDKYTDESVSAFTQALEAGKAILEDLTSSQDEIDKAVKAIEDAKNALEEKKDEPSNPSDNPSNPSNNNPTNTKPTTATPKVTSPTITTVAKPAKVKNVKVIAKKKKLNVSWKKVSGATGYEIQYATNNKFTKNKKSVTVKKNKITIKKLKAKKKYFVKVRAYKLANGNKYYGNWSKVVKKKTK